MLLHVHVCAVWNESILILLPLVLEPNRNAYKHEHHSLLNIMNEHCMNIASVQPMHGPGVLTHISDL